MSFSPYYLLLGVGVGFVFVLLLRNLRLALQFLLTLAKVAGVALLVFLAGWAVGLWRLPRPVAGLLPGMQTLWEPLQRSVLEWIRSALH